MAKKLETKEFAFVLTKMDEEAGTCKGYASVWEVVDSYGDSVKRGAFKKTLKDNRSFPLLWSHNVSEPIGVLGGEEDDHGLAIEGKINLDVQRGREVRALMRQGAVNGLSIGYQTVKEDVNRETGTRVLKEIKLWEVSVCVFQACPGAVVEDVKSEIINVHGEPVELCESCLALLDKEPVKATPGAEKPQGDKGEPGVSHSYAVYAEAVRNVRESIER